MNRPSGGKNWARIYSYSPKKGFKTCKEKTKKVEFSWNSLYGIYGSKHGAEPWSLQKVAILLNLEMGELGKRRELDPPR